MVRSATAFGRNGISDFLFQRVTAVLLAMYTVFLVVWLVFTPELTYEVWRDLYDQLWMRIFTLLALISIAAHAWIGLWAVITDYLTERMLGSAALTLRILILTANAIVTIGYLFWGIEILWGR